jgi:hypothetical protein
MPPPKKSRVTKAPPKPETKTPTAPPNWPAFKPLLPVSDLTLSTVVDSQIVVVRNFWTSTLCKDYVAFLKSLPLVTTPGIPKRGDAVRVNDRFQINDEAFANRLWLETGLKKLVCGSEDDRNEGQGDEHEEGMSREERRELW